MTKFLDNINHPFRQEIDELRTVILNAQIGLTEILNGMARITMKFVPPVIQLIFHCGAKKQEQPKEKLIHDGSDVLIWKENDSAIATFKNMLEIENKREI